MNTRILVKQTVHKKIRQTELLVYRIQDAILYTTKLFI